MRKKFYEAPSIDFKLFQSQEDLLTYTTTTGYPGDWDNDGYPEDGEE